MKNRFKPLDKIIEKKSGVLDSISERDMDQFELFENHKKVYDHITICGKLVLKDLKATLAYHVKINEAISKNKDEKYICVNEYGVNVHSTPINFLNKLRKRYVEADSEVRTCYTVIKDELEITKERWSYVLKDPSTRCLGKEYSFMERVLSSQSDRLKKRQDDVNDLIAEVDNQILRYK